jgi:putative ABC transport system substrate-binding protein
MGAKWLALLHEAVPGMRRVAVVWDSTTGTSQLDAVKTAASSSSIEVVVLQIKGIDSFATMYPDALRTGAQGVLLLSSPIISLKARELGAFTAKNRLPGIAPFREFAEGGGLISYGPDLRDFYRRVPPYVDKILKGASPADLPIQQPTIFELVINAKTAKALGLKIPNALFVRANELIQ